MRRVALVFAGGVGSRMNVKARPKQFLEIHDKPIIVHTIEAFEKHPEIDAVCVVMVESWLDHMRELVKTFRLTKVRWVIAGGDSALASQYNGLSAIASAKDRTEEDVVLIHDGVRPLINGELISDCIASVKQYGSGVTVAPAIETIAQVNENGEIIKTIPRQDCHLARAPQCFYLKDILAMHEKARADGVGPFIDSTSMFLYYGKPVHIVEGPAENIKVTTPSDFYTAKALLDARENPGVSNL